MSSAASFLRALARQLSTASLYGPAHPLLARGLVSAFQELRPLTGGGHEVVFEIEADRVLCDGQEVADLGAGPWRTRLRDAGIERLAFEADIDPPGFELHFHEVARRLGLYDAPPVELTDADIGVASREAGEIETRPSPGTSSPAAPSEAREAEARRPIEPAGEQVLDEAADLIRWIHAEVAGTGRLPSAETHRVVESLRAIEATREPSVSSSVVLAPADGYTTSHCLSVALMATALAAHLEYDEDELGLVTEAALLHDIGKVRLPLEDVGRGGFTLEQRSVMERHPAEGARVLLAGPAKHSLSAVVAYEHHMAFRAEAGYPPRHYPRNAHRFSRLVQICDAYDVLCSPRPFRPALSHESALEYMRLQASSAFDPHLATAFAGLCDVRPLPRIAEPVSGERAPETIELSRMPEGVFDADTETPPIRL